MACSLNETEKRTARGALAVVGEEKYDDDDDASSRQSRKDAMQKKNPQVYYVPRIERNEMVRTNTMIMECRVSCCQDAEMMCDGQICKA